MKRIDGYLDIEQYFKQQLKRESIDLDMLEDKKIIKGEYGGSNCMFWFNYLGVDVLFKVYTTTFGAYSELISEALAKKLELPSAQYDLGTFQGRKGVITYDFKNNEYEYLYVDRDLTVDKILNRKSRKRVATYSLSKIEIMAPFRSYRLDDYRNRQVTEKDYSIGKEEKPDRRYVMYYEGNQRIILSPSEELIQAMKYVAPRKVFTD